MKPWRPAADVAMVVHTANITAALSAAAGQEAAVSAMASLLQERDRLLAEVSQLQANNAQLRVRHCVSMTSTSGWDARL